MEAAKFYIIFLTRMCIHVVIALVVPRTIRTITYDLCEKVGLSLFDNNPYIPAINSVSVALFISSLFFWFYMAAMLQYEIKLANAIEED